MNYIEILFIYPYEAVIDVVFDDTFVVTEGVFVVIDCKPAAELTAMVAFEVPIFGADDELMVKTAENRHIFIMNEKEKRFDFFFDFTSIIAYTGIRYIDNSCCCR